MSPIFRLKPKLHGTMEREILFLLNKGYKLSKIRVSVDGYGKPVWSPLRVFPMSNSEGEFERASFLYGREQAKQDSKEIITAREFLKLHGRLDQFSKSTTGGVE